ncbi:MAG: ferrous iron transport protein A [Peptococcaceae bacterium]|nr:ferrous iron transport protein A [Peptococcaceae bacterium]
MPEMPLAKLPPGRRGIVVSLAADGMARSRLLDLGLVPGAAVEMVRRSPSGDPAAFNIKGALIALRREDAERVTVELA